MTFTTLNRIWISQRQPYETHTDPIHINPLSIATVRATEMIERAPDEQGRRITVSEVVLTSKATYTVLEPAETVVQMAERATLL